LKDLLDFSSKIKNIFVMGWIVGWLEAHDVGRR
jgi:hypothetical protein